ncbi:MAG: diguanylate cyclase, partial [Myxococcota bacterium]
GRQRRELQALSEAKQQALRQLRQEMNKRKALEEELRRLAQTDELTSLNNRRAFMERAQDEVTRYQRYQTPLSVIAMDIDHFKSINDTYGHQVGDEVLVAVSNIIATQLRPGIDIPGRIGGEEFAALLPQTNLEGALSSAERLRGLIAALCIDTPQGKVNVTCSFGVTTLQPGDEAIHAPLKRADQALYQAKGNGRNRVESSGPALLQTPMPSTEAA